MKKIEMKILGLSYSTASSNGSYVLVLSELDGNLKLPIIINMYHAQYIATKTEGLNTKPQLVDIFKNFIVEHNKTITGVSITHILEGIFYAKLFFSDGMSIDSSVGDAICLSLAFDAPIYCSSNVLKISGIEISDNGTVTEEQENRNKEERTCSFDTVESLEMMLQTSLENEDYEMASKIRDKIKLLKDEKG